ncbi:MAG: hypothetical protein QOD47_1793 [Gemmatimonadaceae bacterium]|jgi:hypothetical protein|nr:hypothetical protein [Gemmatimonadaceae bacterium]
MLRNRRITRSRAATERQIMRMVSSPPTVPSMSDQPSPSRAAAIGCAPPGTVLKTSISLTPSSRRNSWGRRVSSAARLSSMLPSVIAYRAPSGVGTRASRSSRKSRERVAWVTSHPRWRRSFRRSSWLLTTRASIISRMVSCRSRLLAIDGEFSTPQPGARGTPTDH